jgi:hypothetical protein
MSELFQRPAPPTDLPAGVAWGVLALILLSSFTLRLNHLGHDAIHAMDESFHAVVSRNLIDRPFTPLLYADPALPYDYRDWKANQVWLHKPALPLWQMAGSMAVFGVEPWALRLPSAVAATGTAWACYAIGACLFGRRVGLTAGALASFNPATFTLVHGYIFSDHVDTALLWWVTLGVWLTMRAAQTGRDAYALAAGAAQGLAFLSKTYPGLIVAVAATALFCRQWVRADGERLWLSRRQIVLFIVAGAVVALPWLTACAVRFPHEFWWEQTHALMHLTRDVEQFAGPWDRVWADYLLRLNHVFFPPLLVSLVVGAVAAWRDRDTGVIFVLAWWIVVVAVFTIATSKTPTSTIIALPAGWVMIGYAASRAVSGDRFAAGGILCALVLGALWPGEFPRQGWGYAPGGGFAGVLREHSWAYWHAGAALVCGAMMQTVARGTDWGPRGWIAVVILLAIPTSWLGYRYVRTAWRITELNRMEPSFRELGRVARALPSDAVLLIEEPGKYQHIAAMFWTGRACYPTTPDGQATDVRRLRAETTRPVYLVTASPPQNGGAERVEGLWLYPAPP